MQLKDPVESLELFVVVLLEQLPLWEAGLLASRHLRGSRQETPKPFVLCHSMAFHRFLAK